MNWRNCLPGLQRPKTVLYARYSTGLQNPRSTDDQLQDLRNRCAREGWEVIGEFKDEAISGAAGIKADVRPGFAAMLEVVEAGQADQILTEATDRLARHQRDALEIFERVTFAGARIFIPRCIDQYPCAHWRIPMDMMRQG
ncbi:recombinase family protein [Novosphingobium decolorationis]|uniref:recombinase family protein n=1 Tax=Novosphingobium decolorationis TaxID=2698673 RepID=UPI0030D10342